ncbi:MAG: hypothetical protein AVO38_00785 [delta proteobacterium ML8_D]|jgi:hypothetical protein|nr:MAG: hypothetical protein AVO38_00785 [delta proteobacterium ML8_D]
MSSMIESIMGMLSGDALNKVSQQIGVPESKAKEALPDVLAVLTGALAKNSSQEQGARELSNALAKDHDGSLLNNLSDYISNYKQASGDGILGHVLGNNRTTVEKSLSQKTGLDMGSIGNLLTMAAPLLMGMLGKTQKTEGLDIGGLTNLLGQESNQAQSLAPGAINILSQILGAGGTQTTPQTTPQTGSTTTKKRSGCATVLIVLVIAVVVYFLLRACSIL